jgi:hypothetical protein
MSFVFSMTYPESLVFLTLALALLFALRARWLASACAGSVAALARPEALLFALPLAAIALASARSLPRAERGRALGAAVAPVASVATFPLYLGWALHDVFAWSHAEAAWGRAFGLHGVVNALAQLFKAGHDPWLWRDVAFAAIYLALLEVARRGGVPWPWLAAGAAALVFPLASGTFMSVARFGLLALPAYWGLAFLARRPTVLRPLLVVSAALLVAGTTTIPLANP